MDYLTQLNTSSLRELEKQNYYVERSMSLEAGVKHFKADYKEKRENREFLKKKLEQ